MSPPTPHIHTLAQFAVDDLSEALKQLSCEQNTDKIGMFNLANKLTTLLTAAVKILDPTLHFGILRFLYIAVVRCCKSNL